MTALGIAPAKSLRSIMAATASGSSNFNGLFRFDPTLDGYIFDLQLVDPMRARLATGDYYFYYMIAGDPVIHSIEFTVT